MAAGCYAQSMSYPQSVGGDFGRNWISSFKAQNPQQAEPNLKNDFWSWGSSPKGSIVVNGNLLPDPIAFGSPSTIPVAGWEKFALIPIQDIRSTAI
jgi:hypothetical protein